MASGLAMAVRNHGLEDHIAHKSAYVVFPILGKEEVTDKLRCKTGKIFDMDTFIVIKHR